MPRERARHRVLLRAGLAAQLRARAVALPLANYTHVARELLHRGVNVIAHVVARAHRRRRHRDQSRQQSRRHRRPAARRREAARRRAADGDARPGAPRNALHARRGQRRRRTPSTCCSITRATTTTCSRRRIRRSPPSTTPSACTPAAWCATAARCRSASASSATPSSIRCCCATSRTSLAARAHRRRHRAQRRADRRRSAAARRSPPACSAPPRCSSTRCSTCIAPASCAAASMTIYRCSARWPRTARARASMQSLLEGLLAARRRPAARRARLRRAARRRRLAQRTPLRGRPHRVAGRRAHRGGSRQSRGARRRCARVPGPRAAGRHGHARRIPARPARLLRGAVGAARIRAAAVRHARRGFHQPAATATTTRCASPQRSHARFVNTTMMLTTLGAAISDGLADGRVVSGVGGQYNFVAMAHALPGARSVLCVRATRRKDGALTLQHRHQLRPLHHPAPPARHRHHRVRHRRPARPHRRRMRRRHARHRRLALPGATARARRSAPTRSTPVTASRPRGATTRPSGSKQAFAAHRRAGLFSEYPFGTDLTREEIELARALRWLKESDRQQVRQRRHAGARLFRACARKTATCSSACSSASRATCARR